MAGGMDLGTSKGGKKALDAQINLVPFIDLMAVTISFLIMTAVWTQIGRLQVSNSGGPQSDEQKEETKTVELQVGDDMKVRLNDPPVGFDEKGTAKKYTAKELRELKGDSKLPGFPADLSNLAYDQMLRVQLVVHKKKPVSKD